MAIAEELTKLEANRANIVAAINSKGGELAENAGLAACPEAISQLGSAGGTIQWTGHVDEAGLRYIGWDDEDINKLKLYVDWDSSEDELYKVPQSHKDLYDQCSKITVDGRTMLPYSEVKKWTQGDFKLKYLPMMDFSSVTNLSMVFADQYWLIAMPNINVENVTTIGAAFRNCYQLLYVPDFNVITGSIWHMLVNCYKVRCINIKRLEPMEIYEGFRCYLSKIPELDTKNVGSTNCDRLFSDANLIEQIPYFDTSKITSMNSMFSDCSRLRRIPLLNTSNVTSFDYTFVRAKSLTTLPAIDTSKATTTQGMFYGCTCLTELPELDVSNTTNVVGMYREINCLRTPLVINFPKVKSYAHICRGISCKSIEWHIHSGVTNMGGCFAYGICEEMHFSEDSVLTSITQSSYLPFYDSNNRINKACVNYTLVKEVFEMMLRGIPNYTADSYPMYFEKDSSVTDDADGTLTTMLNQCTDMKWAVINLTILTA